MYKKGAIIQLHFDTTTSAVLLDKHGKLLYPATVLKYKHHEIEVSKSAFDNFINFFTNSESQPDFDKCLDNKIKENKSTLRVKRSSFQDLVPSSSSSSTSEEEELVEEINK